MQKNLVQPGFTLIELSIVLAIIGLITAGVLVGKDLINQAELRSVIKDVEKYNTAVNTFKAKYNCLAGDCAFATDFFGTQTAGGGCPNPTVASTTESPLTCNGDGNGAIWMLAGGMTITLHERVRFWQHLSAAGLINGSYSGIGNTSLGEGIAFQAILFGFNAPQAKLSRTGFAVYHGSVLNNGGATFWYKYIPNNHVLILGSNDSCDDTVCLMNNNTVSAAESGTTPENALQLDRKVDDGKPGTGVVTAQPPDGGFGYYAQWCTTGTYAQPEMAVYNLTVSNPTCPVVFQAAF